MMKRGTDTDGPFRPWKKHALQVRLSLSADWLPALKRDELGGNPCHVTTSFFDGWDSAMLVKATAFMGLAAISCAIHSKKGTSVYFEYRADL